MMVHKETCRLQATGVKISDNSYTDYFLSKARTDNSQIVGFKSPSGGDLELYSNNTLALTLDNSQDATFADRAITAVKKSKCYKHYLAFQNTDTT